MPQNIDLSLAFLDLDIPDSTQEEARDEIYEVVKTAQLAGRIGWAAVDALQKETANVHARADAIFKSERRAPNYSPALPESDEPLTDDSSVLAKRYLGVRPSKPSHRVEKSANGRWVYEFDERGEIVAGHVIDADD